MATERNAALADNLAQDFRKLNNPAHAWADAISMCMMLPGLVGLWPGSVVGTSGLLTDISGNGLHLTNNNNTAFSNAGPGQSLVPYNGYNGSNQYFSRTTEAIFNITGTESYIASGLNGFTFGTWIYFDNDASAIETYVAKLDATDRNYLMQRRDTGVIRFSVYNSNVATNLDTTATILGDTWSFVVGRFDPSTEMKVWIDADTENDISSIPASIDADAADFTLGATATPSTYLDGRMSLSFLCAAAIPNVFIETLYDFTAPLFGKA